MWALRLCARHSYLYPGILMQKTSPFTWSQSGWQLQEKPLSAIAEQISYPGKRQCCYLGVFIGVRDLIWNP